MLDLIYLSDSFQYDKVKECLKQQFPDAQIEDASDDIHTDRFSIHLIDGKIKEYDKFMLKTGLIAFSFKRQAGMIKGEIGSDAGSFLDKLFEGR